MVTLPSVGGLARQYLASFSGDKFVPESLADSGLLSESGKTLMASIPATNFAAEVAAMKGGMTLEQQRGINETQLAIQELKNEQSKKNAILNQLGGTTMAGTALSTFLGGSGSGFNLGSALSSIGDTSNQTQASGMPSNVGLILEQVDELPTAGQAKLYKGILDKFGKQL